MAEFTGISWTLHSWNPWRGCHKVSPGCKNCLHPSTLVLFADWTWRPISGVKVGDTLVGFNAEGKGLRRFCLSVVEGIALTKKSSVRFRTEHAEIICSKDHRFLYAHRGHWLYAKRLNLGTNLRYIPVYSLLNECSSYKAGYITGMTVGDGTMKWEPGWESVWRGESEQCYWRVAVSDMPILLRLQDYLASFDVNLEVLPFDSGSEGKPMFKLETRSQEVLKIIYNLMRQEENSEFARGWLAGIFDAEGSHGISKYHAQSLRIANTKQDILDKCVVYGNALGFELKIEPHCFNESGELRDDRCPTVRLYGSAQERGRFLGTIRPALQRKVDGLIGLHAGYSDSPVTSIEEYGIQELVDIQTSSETFYANGLATHNCYMFRDQTRWGKEPNVVVRCKTWGQPIKLQKEAAKKGVKEMVFTCSWSDFFIKEADEWRDEAWKIIKQCPNLIFQVLTKRPERILKHLPADWGDGYKNVALGVSVENNKYLERMDTLRSIPANLRFLSAEPLIEPLTGINLDGFGWCIAGGESGRDNRPIKPEWAMELLAACRAKNIPFFYKQGSHLLPGKDRLLDGKIYEEWPEDWLPEAESYQKIS